MGINVSFISHQAKYREKGQVKIVILLHSQVVHSFIRFNRTKSLKECEDPFRMIALKPSQVVMIKIQAVILLKQNQGCAIRSLCYFKNKMPYFSFFFFFFT